MTTNAAKIFAALAKQHPERIALSSVGKEITYGALDQWSDAIAAELRSRLASTIGPVIILSSEPMQVIAAVIATMKEALVFVPLDPQTQPARLLKAIDSADPIAILCDPNGAAIAKELGLPSAIESIEIGALRALDTPLQDSREEDPEGASYIYFTSGSTGEPKGILGRLKSIAHFARWEARAFNLDESVRCTQFTTPAFDAFLRDIFTPLNIGGTVCLPPDRNLIADGERLVGWLDEAAVTLMHTTPAILRILLKTLQARSQRPKTLARVCVAGDVLLPVDVKRFFDVFGTSVELINFYGPSETTMIKLFHRVRAEDAERASVPVGKPIDGCRVLILDNRQKPCGIGMIGEIYIRTPFKSLGYYQRPDLTSEVFVSNPVSGDPDDLVYRTGDLGRMLDDGELEFIGRRDRQIKINGIRVELGEIENSFHEHPCVRDIAIVERKLDEGANGLIAYIVASPEVPEDELRRFMNDRLPTVMIPRHISFLPILPRTVTGKIDYSALPDITPQVTDSAQYVAPQTPVEVTLASIWRELMQIDTPSITANFFSVGGHSLLAMQVLSRVEAAFAISVALRDFLDDPTIRGLAAKIETDILTATADDDELLQLLEQL
ncbi:MULTISPECIES: non-ribosomal peptide synthetase [unclassified Pseudomonas]|uniref:non-ribosomal peptide synthetase n=1 Tax=unclassified Pseudomonas TaxID=196821 RepID=UPI00215EB5B2|nr:MULTISPECIES: non-ribosomal peptide synthetase [unclassified Pseudomonas]UVM52697.1 non-ribosomal peptide synthetase [Pseudomonas sp. B21-015]WPN60167.1 non-ribosomal peptide synthetase [Pseudomonas sp. P9_31]